MGNVHNSVNQNKLSKQKKSDVFMKSLDVKKHIHSKARLKIKIKKDVRSQNEEFIVKYSKSKPAIKHNVNINISDHRRVVFVSLIGIYQTWKNCPSYILYSSLFMIPLKRVWIYHPNKYKQELESSILGQLTVFHTDDESLSTFIQLLKWKDSQGFVFWMLNDHDFDYKEDIENNMNLLVSPFWKCVSLKLSDLYDPVTRSNYKQIDVKSIKQHLLDKGSKFGVSIANILSELYFVTMKYKTIQEILYQSNPESLNPIISYHVNIDIVKPVSFNGIGGNNDDGDWWISSEYDPYDIDNDIIINE